MTPAKGPGDNIESPGIYRRLEYLFFPCYPFRGRGDHLHISIFLFTFSGTLWVFFFHETMNGNKNERPFLSPFDVLANSTARASLVVRETG